MILQQLEYVLASVAAGAAVVLAYDLLLVFREIMWHSRFLIVFEDMVFWIAAGAAVFFIVIYKLNQGSLRGYAAAGIVTGMFLGHMLLGKRMLRLVRRLLDFS